MVGYYPEYLGRLGQVDSLSGTNVKAIDDDTQQLNAEIKADFATPFDGVDENT